MQVKMSTFAATIGNLQLSTRPMHSPTNKRIDSAAAVWRSVFICFLLYVTNQCTVRVFKLTQSPQICSGRPLVFYVGAERAKSLLVTKNRFV